MDTLGGVATGFAMDAWVRDPQHDLTEISRVAHMSGCSTTSTMTTADWREVNLPSCTRYWKVSQ
eukprot:3599304-Pyramimonas_sp.AAC.2